MPDEYHTLVVFSVLVIFGQPVSGYCDSDPQLQSVRRADGLNKILDNSLDSLLNRHEFPIVRGLDNILASDSCVLSKPT